MKKDNVVVVREEKESNTYLSNKSGSVSSPTKKNKSHIGSQKSEPKCMFLKDDKCGSMYSSVKCDGVNLPKGCPYPFEEKDDVVFVPLLKRAYFPTIEDYKTLDDGKMVISKSDFLFCYEELEKKKKVRYSDCSVYKEEFVLWSDVKKIMGGVE